MSGKAYRVEVLRHSRDPAGGNALIASREFADPDAAAQFAHHAKVKGRPGNWCRILTGPGTEYIWPV